MTALRELAKSYFDTTFYLDQTDSAGRSDPFVHYMKKGAAAGLSPCKYFDQAWYTWQNPDCLNSHKNSFFHYLDTGRFEGRDPSPLVDIVRLRETLGYGIPNEAIGDMVLRNRAPLGCGLYANYSDLEVHQKRFYDAIHPTKIRTSAKLERRKNLVILQAGESGLHHTWFDQSSERNWIYA